MHTHTPQIPRVNNFWQVKEDICRYWFTLRLTQLTTACEPSWKQRQEVLPIPRLTPCCTTSQSCCLHSGAAPPVTFSILPKNVESKWSSIVILCENPISSSVEASEHFSAFWSSGALPSCWMSSLERSIRGLTRSGINQWKQITVL